MKRLYNIYVASGWFSKEQYESYTQIRECLEKHERNIECYYPKDHFEFKHGEKQTKSQQAEVFSDNISAIINSDFVIVNTEGKDMGSLFEAGVAYAYHKKIIYVCLNLGDALFNVMLAQSGMTVVKTIEELDYALKIISEHGFYSYMMFRGYEGEIE
jgi:nucleoside 2-deoxyribosyltransferase